MLLSARAKRKLNGTARNSVAGRPRRGQEPQCQSGFDGVGVALAALGSGCPLLTGTSASPSAGFVTLFRRLKQWPPSSCGSMKSRRPSPAEAQSRPCALRCGRPHAGCRRVQRRRDRTSDPRGNVQGFRSFRGGWHVACAGGLAGITAFVGYALREGVRLSGPGPKAVAFPRTSGRTIVCAARRGFSIPIRPLHHHALRFNRFFLGHCAAPVVARTLPVPSPQWCPRGGRRRKQPSSSRIQSQPAAHVATCGPRPNEEFT